MKEWFILIKQHEEGPYSVKQLRHHPLVTPDTFARKIGWTSWKKIKEIEELEELFEDSEALDEQPSSSNKLPQNDEIALNRPTEPSRFLFWLTVIALIILYLYTLMNKHG